MWIYVNSCEFIDNKWCFNNKNVFTAIRVVWASGGSEPQNLKMVSLRFFNPLISKHIKNKGIKNLFSKPGFYKMTF